MRTYYIMQDRLYSTIFVVGFILTSSVALLQSGCKGRYESISSRVWTTSFQHIDNNNRLQVPVVDVVSKRVGITKNILSSQTKFRRHSFSKRNVLYTTILHVTADDIVSSNDKSSNSIITIRQRMKDITGFSLTTFRASARTITGISATAVYTSTAAATSYYIRTLLKYMLQLFPPSLRYFIQPLLIVYFVPLFIIRTICNNNRFREEDDDNTTDSYDTNNNISNEPFTTVTNTWQQKQHESFVAAWKHAVNKADRSTSYWPIHVDSVTDSFYTDYNELSLNDAILESISVASEKEQQQLSTNSISEYNLSFFAKRSVHHNNNSKSPIQLPLP